MKKSSKIFMAILCGLSLVLNLVITSPQALAYLPNGSTYLNRIDIQTTVDEYSAWDNFVSTGQGSAYNTILTNYDTHYNTEDDALEIDSAEKLAAVAKLVNYGKKPSMKNI